MSVPLAWRNVTHQSRRSLAATAGISLAILLIFMQLGFHSAAARSATLIFNALDFELLVISRQYQHIARTGSFPRHRLYQAAALDGVASVAPLDIGWGYWRNEETRKRYAMLVLAVDPAANPFSTPELGSLIPGLKVTDTILVDRRSQRQYGVGEVGSTAELSNHRVRMLGRYTIGTGFACGGAATTGIETFARIFSNRDLSRTSLGLIRLHPGTSTRKLRAALADRLPGDVTVLTRKQIEKQERSYSLEVKPIGIVFTSGVAIAFLVGGVILYQVLASEVQSRIHEYATLKAMGFHARRLNTVVFQQGLILCGVGFVPAILIAMVLYSLLRSQANLPVNMEVGRILLVAVLTGVMSWTAGALAVLKIRRADPADLF